LKFNVLTKQLTKEDVFSISTAVSSSAGQALFTMAVIITVV
jgi:hypothetical protein